MLALLANCIIAVQYLYAVRVFGSGFLTFISATPWNPSVCKTCLPMIIVLLEIIIARVHIGQPRLLDGRKCGRFNTVRPVQKRLSLRASVLGQKLLVRTFALEVGNDSFITTRADC